MSDSEHSDHDKQQYKFDSAALDAADAQRAQVTGGSFMHQFTNDNPSATAGEQMQYAQLRAAEKAFKGDNFDIVFEKAIQEELKKSNDWDPKKFYVRNGVIDKYKFIFQYRDQAQLIFHKIKDPTSLTQNKELQTLIKKVAKLIRKEGANTTPLNGIQTHLMMGVTQSLLAISEHTQKFAEMTSRVYDTFNKKLVDQIEKDVPSLPWLKYFRVPEIEKDLRGNAEVGKRISHLISCLEPVILKLFQAKTTGDLETALKQFRVYERMFPVDLKPRSWWREENKVGGLKTIRITKSINYKDYLFESENADKLVTLPIIPVKDEESNEKKKKRKRRHSPSPSSDESSDEETSRPRRKRRKHTKGRSGGRARKRPKSPTKQRERESKKESKRKQDTSDSESETPESKKTTPVRQSIPPVSPAPEGSHSSRGGRNGNRQGKHR